MRNAAALDTECDKFRRANASLWAALWFSNKRRLWFSLAAAICLGIVGYEWVLPLMDNLFQQGAALVSAWLPEKPDSAVDPVRIAMRDTLSDWSWSQGDSLVVVRFFAGQPCWVLVRGDIDDTTHTNAEGHAIVRHCLHLFVTPATRHDGEYLTARPYISAYLLPSGTREDAHAVVEHAIHRLPVFVAFERRLGTGIVDALVFEVVSGSKMHSKGRRFAGSRSVKSRSYSFMKVLCH
jgi:hypothetical protein